MKNSKWWFVATVSMMILGCGKSMSLKVSGMSSDQPTLETATTIDTTRVSQASTIIESEQLVAFSKFDSKNHHFSDVDHSTLSRVILQVPPHEAVQEIMSFKLDLKGVHKIDGSEKFQICIEKSDDSVTCESISAESIASSMSVDLENLFDLNEKKDVEIMDWIHAHSASYANPGYRKLRVKLDGLLIDSGTLTLQLITNDQLPKGFAIVPSDVVHGDDDLE